ncbi:hypothetical protein ACF1GY_05615 [Streptomyces sp. NPDC014684]|uniref:hypothetical protein n=1 Tax=Streptomyces sp. NPDC014684 TaxID=3364880 RepID=UPI0036F98E78
MLMLGAGGKGFALEERGIGYVLASVRRDMGLAWHSVLRYHLSFVSHQPGERSGNFSGGGFRARTFGSGLA